MSQDQHRDLGDLGDLGDIRKPASPRGLPGAGLAGACEPTVPDDLVAMLDLLAQTIVQALGFGVAAINIVRADGSLEVVSVAGDADARRVLLGTVYSAEVWDQILAVTEPWGRLRFADHRSQEASQNLLSWIPDTTPIDTEDAWDPEDALFAPLTAADGSRLGILSVDLPHDGRRPGPATCSALEAFAVSTALAIEHATLRARAEASERLLRHLAKHDSLTGVGNRLMLFERLQHASSARPERRSLLALAFLDIDDFKAINDSHTHVVGDHILKAVAGRIRTVVRPHDTVVRWGGDEFLVLLEHVDDEAAGVEVVERILAAIAEPIVHLGQEFAVTACLGLVFCRTADEIDADQLVGRADSAMYRAKHIGDNSYAVFDSVDQTAS